METKLCTNKVQTNFSKTVENPKNFSNHDKVQRKKSLIYNDSKLQGSKKLPSTPKIAHLIRLVKSRGVQLSVEFSDPAQLPLFRKEVLS